MPGRRTVVLEQIGLLTLFVDGCREAIDNRIAIFVVLGREAEDVHVGHLGVLVLGNID